MFPAVFLPTTISNIMRHTFAPMDLVTLNPRRKGEKFVKAGTLRDYPTLHSLLVPLATYFSVLQAACAAMGNEQATRLIGEGGLRYTAHLVELEEAFQWPAVVQYHMQLHEKRRHDMMNGDYSQWAFGDKELKNRLLVGRDRGQRGGMQSSASAKSCPKKF
ncbi:hypothetical protein C8R46DRAFT_913989 [Mycena filopes]|nr:hypothetical protein C8R46DRAFT_913989 [Mycena filopes]